MIMKAACEREKDSVRLDKHVVTEKAWPRAIRNGLICAFVVAACLWAAYPVAEMGFIDDWSYIKTAQVFAQTGHFVYNGWATAMLGWQIVWGALFLKLFGFSFTVVRLSMLPVDVASIFLFHAVLVRFGINPRNAVVGTLTLGLSPLFLPLAASYMTDVAGLFIILLCLYLCQRASAAETSNATIAWLCLAAGTNIVGGTVRQIAWLGALVMVPSAGWLLRKRRGVLFTSFAMWALTVVSVFACMRWFDRQPYSVPEAPVTGVVPSFRAFHSFVQLVGSLFFLSLVTYPVLVAWLPKLRGLNRASILRIVWITLGWGSFQWATKWTMPWLYHVINSEFAAGKTGEMLSPKPISLLMWAREAIALAMIVTALALVEHYDLWSRVGNKTIPELWSSIKSKKARIASWQDMLVLLGPFTLSYFVLLLPRAYHSAILDRYLLPIMAIAIICLLRTHQESVAPTLPTLSIATLALFSLLAIGGTHDWFAWERARLAAINEIRASGVPRTEIQGGFEYDGWTQIEKAGYINDPSLKIPVGAYHAPTGRQTIPDDCTLDFAPFTPRVHPKFTVSFGKMWCLAPSKFPAVSYRTWLPPYNRKIMVQEVPEL